MTLEQILDAIYASENNVSITCFWDGGWDVKLGDPLNGFKAQGNVDLSDQIAPWLEAEAKKHIPELPTAPDPALPPGYVQWAEACNKVASQPFQPLGAVHAPLLPCPNDPERFWVLYQGVRILKHWSEIPALWATSNQS